MPRGDDIGALIKDVDKLRDKLLKHSLQSKQTAIKDRTITVAVKRAEKQHKKKSKVPPQLAKYVFKKQA